MRRAILPLLLIVCLDVGASPGPGAELASDLAATRALVPRPEGSANEARLLAWIASRLDETGVAHQHLDFDSAITSHSFSSSLRADVPGATADTLLVAVPLDGPRDERADDARADRSASVALALELLRLASQAPPPLSLTVLFLGAEYGEGAVYPLGTKLFLQDFQPAFRTAVVCLDLSDLPGGVVLVNGGRGSASPPWLLLRCFDALQDAGIDADVPASSLAVHRLSLSDRPTRVDPWIAAGMPAIGIADAAGGGSPEQASAFLQRLLDAGASGIPAEWDHHYLMLDLGGRPLILSEGAWVATLTGMLGLLLAYSLLAIGGLKRYLRALGRNLHVIVPMLLVTWALLAAAGFVVEALLALRRFPGLWELRPRAFLIAKLAIAAAPLGALGWLVRRLPLPRDGSFWSAATLLLLLVDVLVVAALEVSLAAPFLCAFLCVFAASRTRRPLAKLAWFLPSAAWIAVALGGAVSFPALPLVRFLLFSRVWGNLLTAVVALPFVLFLVRLALLFTRRRSRTAVVAAAGILPAAFAVASLASLLTWSPWSSATPRPVMALQVLDEGAGVNRIEFACPESIGPVWVEEAGSVRRWDFEATSAVLKLAARPAVPISVGQTSEVSLGRRTVTLAIRLPAGVRRVEAVLASPSDFVLYDCSFPFERENGRRCRLAIGAFPPDPLPLSVTIPEAAACTLELGVEVQGPLLEAAVTAAGARVATRLRLVTRVRLAE